MHFYSRNRKPGTMLAVCSNQPPTAPPGKASCGVITMALELLLVSQHFLLLASPGLQLLN